MAALVLLGLGLPTSSVSAAGDEVRLRIVHTNDIHGHLFAGRDDLASGAPKPQLGGALALARLIGRERLRAKREGGHLLVLDAGDVFHGAPEGDLDDGAIMVELFHRLGVDAAVPGNHEFACGPKSLARLLGDSKFPWLAANLEAPKGHALSGLVGAVMERRIGGVPVAIVGVTTPRCPHLNRPVNTAGLTFRSATMTVPPLVAELRSRGRVVIVLSHLGSDLDGQLAGLMPEVPVIIGGHDHVVLTQEAGRRRTHVAQTGEYLRRAGVIDMRLAPAADGEGARVLAMETRVLNLAPVEVGEVTGPSAGETTAEERAVAALLDEVRMRSYDVPVAISRRAFPRDLRPRGPERLHVWVAEAMRATVGAHVALAGPGAIRGGLPEGPITLRDLYLCSPFQDEVVVLELDGRALIKSFRDRIRYGHFDCGVAGVNLTYDVTAGSRRRVSDVRATGEPVEPGGRYRLAVTRFELDRLKTRRRIKPLAEHPTGQTTFELLLEHLDVAPDPAAAAGGLIGAALIERGDRELAEVREPPAWGIENRSPAKLWSSNKIDVNSASVTLLATLPWLGPAKARAIISERDRRGGFRSLKELSQVAGISKHDLDRFERFLKVE